MRSSEIIQKLQNIQMTQPSEGLVKARAIIHEYLLNYEEPKNKTFYLYFNAPISTIDENQIRQIKKSKIVFKVTKKENIQFY